MHTITPEEPSKQDVTKDVGTSSAQNDPTNMQVKESHEELGIITTQDLDREVPS
jgi:hypothetical protein